MIQSTTKNKKWRQKILFWNFVHKEECTYEENGENPELLLYKKR